MTTTDESREPYLGDDGERTVYPEGRDCMDITLVARQARWNSERWFPELHARLADDIRIHYVLGLVGESGEVADLFKKIGTGKRTFEDTTEEMEAELADVFTYLILLADELGVDLIEAFTAKQRICEQRWGDRS